MRITELLKRIKIIVADPSKADSQDPIMVATTYAGQCQVVNERLKKCLTLIQKNMVPQALEEAGEEPHLIDLCNEMAGKTIIVWKNLCMEKGWPIPGDLDMDAFNELMKSFSTESTIEPLLKQLRRANNQGHIGQCVAILRELVKKDTANPQWQSDLAEFETAYLEKIKQDIDNCRSEKDINGVARVIVEIKQPWSIPVDSIPVQELEDFIEEHYRGTLRQEEDEIVSKISISFQSGNVEALGDAIFAYNNLEKNRYFKPDPSLHVIYSNALNWYQQQLKAIEIQKSYERKLGEINNKIERSDYYGVKALWDEIKRHRLPISEELEHDVQRLIHEEQKAQKRQQRKKQMGYVFIIIFTMICISFAATWNYYRQIRNRLTAEFDSAVAAENLEECNSTINNMAGRRIVFINNPLFSSSEMKNYQDKAKGVASLLEEKRAEFELLIAELEELKAEGFPRTTEEIESKMSQIKATSNAVSSRNLARLKLLQSAWKDRKTAIRAMEEKELASIFEQINYQFKNLLPAANEEDIYINQQTLEKIKEFIASGKKLTSVSDLMKKNLDNLNAQMNSMRETLSIRKSLLREFVNVRSLNEYFKELQTFAGTFPNDPVTKTINPIIEMVKLYNSFLEVPVIKDSDNEAEEDIDNTTEETSANGSEQKGNTKSDKRKNQTAESSNDHENPFWSATSATLKAFNNNIRIHKSELQEEIKKMEQTSRFVDLWECTVVRPNFEPEKWYFNGKPSEDFINGIKSYSGIVYVLSPDDLQPEFKANSAITIQVQDLKKMSHCDVVEQMLNNISYDIGMESIVQEINNIYSQTFSPILKLHLISFLTDQLFTLVGRENAMPFIAMDKDLKRFNKRPLNDQVNWLCSSNKKYTFASRQAEMILRHYLERPDKMNEHVAQLKLKKMAMKRMPRWVGFADFKNPEQLHFKTDAKPNEVWVVRNGHGGNNSSNIENKGNSTSGDENSIDNESILAKPLVFVTQEQRMGEKIKLIDHNGYLPGEPLFAPYDNNTTSEVLQSILSNTNLDKTVNIEWPESWPVNVRR
ncbi:MAG: hypothetical protein HQK70_07240 [Desulfamplus sp.]|nr:hypothetical protein [Desulfamplus sp.]